jgi:hypothetical protein
LRRRPDLRRSAVNFFLNCIAQIDRHLAKTVESLAGFLWVFGNGAVPGHEDVCRQWTSSSSCVTVTLVIIFRYTAIGMETASSIRDQGLPQSFDK